jgi:cation-transporting ATPase E
MTSTEPAAPTPTGETDVPVRPPGSPLHGLTEAEVVQRRAAGLGNHSPLKTSRSYGRILLDNVFNFINNVLFALGITLVALGRYLDALISVGVVVANSIVGVVQETRAKRTLDRIAILTRPKATVVREGREQEIDPSDIVQGDTLFAHSGDQIVVDGPMLGEGFMEMDESLLTGESDLVRKEPGDMLLSGSFVVNGSGHYLAEKVGVESFANRITAGAQAFRRVLTPLQRRVHLVVRSLLLVVVYFEILVIVKSLVDNIPFVEGVRMSTVIVGLIPNGLILSIAVAYALGAVRMAGKGALIQQANSVESLSNVDVLCTDKTGTLTSNNIRFHDLEPLELPEEELTQALADYAVNSGSKNRTSEALSEAFGGRERTVEDEILFSSARKWGAVSFAGPERQGTFVLGAPETVVPLLAPNASTGTKAPEWASHGYRVLMFAYAPEPAPLHDETGDIVPPSDLRPGGVVCLSDELRPQVEETLDGFRAAGVEIKVISGDNPQTVAALAKQAGFATDLKVLSGAEIESMEPAHLADAAEEATVFGRVTPDQKEALVEALRSRGYYVAMIGDGVNDVISLKKAHVGIAMQGGTQAARGVADMILLGDSFGALPYAFKEGQRIVNGMLDILRIFMVRILFKSLLIASTAGMMGFPFAPRQSSLLSFLAAGIPAVALAYWAPSGTGGQGHLFRKLFHFAVPATLVLSLMALGVYVGYLYPGMNSYLADNPAATSAEAFAQVLPVAQTATTAFAILCSLLLLPFAVPPTEFFAGGARLRGDWRPTILAGGLTGLFALIALVPLGRTLFDLYPLPFVHYLLLGGLTALWALITRSIWRGRLLERFFGLWHDGEDESEVEKGATVELRHTTAQVASPRDTALQEPATPRHPATPPAPGAVAPVASPEEGRTS